MSIASYFGIEMTRVDTADWDAVEELVKKIIKSSRAGDNFKMDM
jgi:ATP-dependent RNA helicase DDX19/DBP5